MASALSLDRNAKRAVAVLALVVMALLVTTAWKSIVALTPESAIAQPTAESEDEIIQIGSHALLLEHGSSANRFVHWLHPGTGNSRAFDLGRRSFAPHSATLSPEGLAKAAAIADMMTHVKALDAHIFLESGVTEPQLEEPRAIAVRGTLIADGVSPARITVSDNAIPLAKGSPKDPDVVVVLTA